MTMFIFNIIKVGAAITDVVLKWTTKLFPKQTWFVLATLLTGGIYPVYIGVKKLKSNKKNKKEVK